MYPSFSAALNTAELERFGRAGAVVVTVAVVVAVVAVLEEDAADDDEVGVDLRRLNKRPSANPRLMPPRTTHASCCMFVCEEEDS